jgi:hypothetical protein
MELNVDTFDPHPVGKLYGWGDYGLVKGSTSSEAWNNTTGPGWVLNPTASSTPTASQTLTPSPTPTGATMTPSPTSAYTMEPIPTRVKEYIRVVYGTAFPTPGAGMAVEMLVKFGSAGLSSNQMLIGSDSYVPVQNTGTPTPAPGTPFTRGYRLAYEQIVVGETLTNHLAWRVGYGATNGNLEAKEAVSITPESWYYVVGVYRPPAGPSSALQELWINGTLAETTNVPNGWTPSWGTEEFWVGASPLGSCCNLKGSVGGYVSLLHNTLSAAFIEASSENFLDYNNFVEFGAIENQP